MALALADFLDCLVELLDGEIQGFNVHFAIGAFLVRQFVNVDGLIVHFEFAQWVALVVSNV